MTDPTPYTSYRIAGWCGLSGGQIRLLTNAAFDDPIMQRSRALVHDGAELHQLVALFTARTDLAYALVGPVGDVTQVVVRGAVRADLVTSAETIEVAGTPDGGDWAGHMITAPVLGVMLTATAGTMQGPQPTIDPGVRATAVPAGTPSVTTPDVTAPALRVPDVSPVVPAAPAAVEAPVERAATPEPRLPDPSVPAAAEIAPDRTSLTSSAPPTVPPPPPLRPPSYAAAALRSPEPLTPPDLAAPDLPAPGISGPAFSAIDSPPPDPIPPGSTPPEPATSEPVTPDRAVAVPDPAPPYAVEPHVEEPYREPASPAAPRDAMPADAAPSTAPPSIPAPRTAGLISDVSWASMLDGPADSGSAPAAPSRIEEARWADAAPWSAPSPPAEPAYPNRSAPGGYGGPDRSARPAADSDPTRSTPWSDPMDYTSRTAAEPATDQGPWAQPVRPPDPSGWTQAAPPARPGPVVDTSRIDAGQQPPIETVGWAAETGVMPMVPPARQDLDVTIWRPIAESSVMAGGAGTVSAVRCVDGHLNPLMANSCRVCTKLVPPQEPVTVGRPPLGVVRMSTSDTIRLDHGIVFGRDPGSPDGNRRDQPYFVMLADKDISRRHLEVVLDGWDVLVVDLHSSNGSAITMPGGVPEVIPAGARRQLVPGTVVHLSDSISFVFEVTA